MLATATLPEQYITWNQRYKAPSGASWWTKWIESGTWKGDFLWHNRFKLPEFLIQSIGPFGFQKNSKTRSFEYPWCFYATPLEPGMKIIELGAGASGFQFVLAQNGLDVTSIDPLINPSESVDWQFTAKEFNQLNRAFGNQVHFFQDFIQNANLDENSCDRIFTVSALEHIPPSEMMPIAKEVGRILKPGGMFIATVDLFLDCYPFTQQISNQFGCNISVFSFIEQTGLHLKVGDPKCLYGFSEFNPTYVQENLNQFYRDKAVLTQCFVLEKRL